jgi:hypothetical protein
MAGNLLYRRKYIVTPSTRCSEKTLDPHLPADHSTQFSQAAILENKGDCYAPDDPSQIDQIQGKSVDVKG